MNNKTILLDIFHFQQYKYYYSRYIQQMYNYFEYSKYTLRMRRYKLSIFRSLISWSSAAFLIILIGEIRINYSTIRNDKKIYLSIIWFEYSFLSGHLISKNKAINRFLEAFAYFWLLAKPFFYHKRSWTPCKTWLVTRIY